jgi:mycothiol system anti-sigma-R factor
MECLDCIQATARLHLYLDRELSMDETEIVQQHLVACPQCECRFHFDRNIKKLIHERCTIMHAPTYLREAIMRLAHGEQVAINLELEMGIRADLEGY